MMASLFYGRKDVCSKVLIFVVTLIAMPIIAFGAVTNKPAMTTQQTNAQKGPLDVTGWVNTRWGMTRGDFIKLYPDAKPDGDKFLSVNMKINSSDCRVSALFHNYIDKSDTLSEVTVNLGNNEVDYFNYLGLDELLSIKFGQKSWSATERNKYVYREYSSWHFKSSVIRLLFQQSDSNPYLKIVYSLTQSYLHLADKL